MAYDEKCYRLAEEFLLDTTLPDVEGKADRLAQQIQNVIETFIKYECDNYEPPEDPVAWSGGFAPNY
jgi:hypothetical protein